MPARDFFDDLQEPQAPSPPTAPAAAEVTVLDPEAQQSVAARLQTKWLVHMEKLIDNGLVTSTDLATLARVLLANGWSLDPKKLPQNLQSLVGKMKMEDDEETGRPKLVKMA